MRTVTLTIDGVSIGVEQGTSILEAARYAGIYVPSLCHHPDLSPAHDAPVEQVFRANRRIDNQTDGVVFEGCRLCLVEVEGRDNPVRACHTLVEDGMVVHNATECIRGIRRERLVAILERQPAVCLACVRGEDSADPTRDEQRCSRSGACELQQVARFIGLPEQMPERQPDQPPLVESHVLFTRDHGLCVGCTRCVRVCRDVRGCEALGFVFDQQERVVVGLVAPSPDDAGCRYCTACVEVCPTGAMSDKHLGAGGRQDALVPCRAACPAGIEIPDLARLIAEGKTAEAAAVIREKIPLPNVLGAVCTRPCEKVCRRRALDQPVAIRDLVRFIASHDDGAWQEMLVRPRSGGKHVAVVGSGPAGLTAAWYLTRKGHRVCVFEAEDQIGGTLRTCMPRYLLAQEELERDLAPFRRAGVDFRTRVRVGADVSFSDLIEEHDAVFLGVGASVGRRTRLPGDELDGVLWGIDLLRAVNRGEGPLLSGTVVVAGGDDMAIHAALTAVRLGARDVCLVRDGSPGDLPAHARACDVAMEEGVALMASWAPDRILGDGGRVCGIELKRSADGGEKTGRLDCDVVVLAFGRQADLGFLEGFGVELVDGLVRVDSSTQATSRSGIYAGGDAVTATGSVIDAVAAGRRAAAAIDRQLGGDGDIDETLLARTPPAPGLGPDKDFAARRRQTPARADPDERVAGFDPVTRPLDRQQAEHEARRCLQCDLRLQLKQVTLPP